MTTLRVDSIGDGYHAICRQVLSRGSLVRPRDQLTKELLDVVIVTSPYDTLPTGWGRDVVPAIGVVEALQLIGGVSVPDLAVAVVPNMGAFLDDGRFWGAYGERAQRTEQVLRVIQKIRSDRDTRQAVMTIWDPARDNVSGKHDYPCTISLIFMVRNKKLNLHVTMRSNDVWWGLSYDAFQFTQLQLAVANVLEIDAGEYRHHAVSLHAYERDWKKINELQRERSKTATLYGMVGVGQPGDSWSQIQRRARYLLRGEEPKDASGLELWMQRVLAPSIEKVQS